MFFKDWWICTYYIESFSCSFHVTLKWCCSGLKSETAMGWKFYQWEHFSAPVQAIIVYEKNKNVVRQQLHGATIAIYLTSIATNRWQSKMWELFLLHYKYIHIIIMIINKYILYKYLIHGKYCSATSGFLKFITTFIRQLRRWNETENRKCDKIENAIFHGLNIYIIYIYLLSLLL